MDQGAVDALVELMDLEKIEENLFRGRSPDVDRQRVFGGQVAGQALVAAARTVEPDRSIHSLHSYFLRPGDPAVPILYEVDRSRDGRSFTTRRVQAIQHGRPIFVMSASFHVHEDGFDHQFPMPTGCAPPESLPDFHQRMEPWKEQLGDWYTQPRAIDTRYCEWHAPTDTSPQPPFQNVWFRASGNLPDEPVLHAVVATYASDMTVLDTSMQPHGGSGLGNIFMASLDHAMWFHRPFRADAWLLYAQDSPSASGGRGLGRGLMFTQEGALVCSVVQEGLIRPNRSNL
jgi:acyl-CoA thioesterase-2